MKAKLFRLTEKTIYELEALVELKAKSGEPTSEAAEVRTALVRYLSSQLVPTSRGPRLRAEGEA